jgi:hypothetical protein
MTTDDRSTLASILAAADARWQRHVEVLDRDPAWRIRGPDDPFVAAQEYGHQAHWLEYATARLRARLDGAEAPPRITDFDEANAAWAEEDARVPHEEARERASRARDAYIALVSGAAGADERLLTGAAFLLIDHVDEHFRYMVQGIQRHESDGWERITAILDATPTGTVHRGDDGTDWRASDVYAHLWRWMDVQFPRVEAFLAVGEVPELPATTDELNVRWLREDAELSFAEARRRAFLARDRFVESMRAMPIERWTNRLVSLYAGNSVGHYEEHLGYFAAGRSAAG